MSERSKDYGAFHLRPTAAVVVGASLVCASLFGQLAPNGLESKTFHIEGTISSPLDSMLNSVAVRRSMLKLRGQMTANTNVDDKDSDVAAPRTAVTFHGEHVTKTVTVDEKGAYQLDLPIGFYKMTADGPQIGSLAVTEYVRIFRVMSSATVTLNGSLYLARTNCDVVVSGDTEVQRLEKWKNECGGEDSFPFPAKDGVPLELYVRYSRREATPQGYVYRSDQTFRSYVPIFVAYNLFALEAQKVVYDQKARTIEASGNVIVTDATGTAHHTDAIKFVIKDGEVVVP